MAQKPEPRTAKGISNLAAAMAAGIDEEPGLVTFISKAEMVANRLAFNAAEANFNAGRLALSNANKTSQAAEVALFDWLGAAKSVFAASFGLYWSTEWAAAGFINNSTAIPREIGERIGLTEDIVEFLTANPTYQVTSLNVTIDYGSDVHASAVAGQKAVSDAEMARDGLETARQGARTTVIAGMRGLIKNLDAKLGPMDPRWLAFGLQKPGALVTPAKPTGLTLTLMGTDALQVTCDAMPLATRYRWRMRVVGPGTVYNRVASTVAPLAVIRPVPAGQMVEIIVQAVNENLQSVASAPVAIDIPPVVALAAEAKAAPAPVVEELAPLAVGQPNGNKKTKATGSNGNGNGSHAVSRLV